MIPGKNLKRPNYRNCKIDDFYQTLMAGLLCTTNNPRLLDQTKDSAYFPVLTEKLNSWRKRESLRKVLYSTNFGRSVRIKGKHSSKHPVLCFGEAITCKRSRNIEKRL
ncbi:hypothetical protein CDAR_450521 [Caerostris darwini]|uniref:LAGLIDADG homing endonuclease n=1 Tax=Caerostris darwini TaxID=1538125 RepID=A0AAV4WS05_9ARAC|nr:hypothetical protein CDAR_450521 [Caerostris darwini]